MYNYSMITPPPRTSPAPEYAPANPIGLGLPVPGTDGMDALVKFKALIEFSSRQWSQASKIFKYSLVSRIATSSITAINAVIGLVKTIFIYAPTIISLLNISAVWISSTFINNPVARFFSALPASAIALFQVIPSTIKNIVQLIHNKNLTSRLNIDLKTLLKQEHFQEKCTELTATEDYTAVNSVMEAKKTFLIDALKKQRINTITQIGINLISIGVFTTMLFVPGLLPTIATTCLLAGLFGATVVNFSLKGMILYRKSQEEEPSVNLEGKHVATKTTALEDKVPSQESQEEKTSEATEGNHVAPKTTALEANEPSQESQGEKTSEALTEQTTQFYLCMIQLLRITRFLTLDIVKSDQYLDNYLGKKYNMNPMETSFFKKNTETRLGLNTSSDRDYSIEPPIVKELEFAFDLIAPSSKKEAPTQTTSS